MSKIYYVERFFTNTTFTDIEIEILNCIIDALHKNTSTNIKLIAEKCFTSPSTVSRFVKKTKFNNYNELIFFLKEKLNSNTTYNMEALPFVTSSEPIKNTIKDIHNYLLSHQIYVYGEGFCRFMCTYLYKKLLVLKYIPIDLEGVELKLVHSSSIPPVLFIFSRSGETKTCLN